VRVLGLSAAGPVPDEPLVALGLAGALVTGVDAGTVLSAERVVDEQGDVIWEGEPWPVPGARPAVLCAVGQVVDDPVERAELAERTGAIACDMESGALASTGRLRGVVRAVADGPERPLGALAQGAQADGSVAWSAVLSAFLREPVASARSARSARRGLAALSRSMEVGARG
jgi:nucleoside phosphorylase